MRLFTHTMRSARALTSVLRHQQRALSSAAAPQSFRKILIANRGEIALRVIRSAQKLGIETVAVYSDADANAQHVKQATEAYNIGPAPAAESYLNYHKILEVCKLSGAQAVHPGYGFLSENAEFARACAAANVEFIGPPVEAIEAMGSKSASKDIMIAAGVPVTPGYHGEDQSFERLRDEARKIGYPVLLKAVLGGGGKGMRIVDAEEDLQEALEACQREGKASFGDGRVLVEKYLRKPRHVELQVFGDKFGNVVHLFERDCSVQRRHQKVLEEAPAPHMSEALREKMGSAAVAAAKAVGYCGAGTVEFLLDEDESFYFMEMNTRLQVEHPVTELITKQDLVELQLKVAAGHPLPLRQQDLRIHGHAIEARIYAENPANNFLPGSGRLHHLRLPPASDHVRVDTGVVQGDEVSIFYDPMIAKLIVHGETRAQALDRLVAALHQYQIVGLPTNIEFVARCATHPEFRRGGVDTSFLLKHGDDVLSPLPPTAPHATALAAVSLVLRQQQAAQRAASPAVVSAWGAPALAGFRSLETAQRAFELERDGETVGVRVLQAGADAFDVALGGSGEALHVRDARLQASGDFSMRVGPRVFRGTAVVHKHEVHVFCDDGSQRYAYKFGVALPSLEAADGAGAGSAHRKIVTPMPGKIIKVLVRAGDAIKEDQPLLIMEAMKMEHVIRATKDGKVEDVFADVGDFVADGHVLIELD
ncbi:hypothetical protein ATCC90586_003932 [Pythium insidiosum]|nr:hypothetical protein ATCC90586_003932 [Pythium insidiosum]